jgi:hypothetical protein
MLVDADLPLPLENGSLFVLDGAMLLGAGGKAETCRQFCYESACGCGSRIRTKPPFALCNPATKSLILLVQLGRVELPTS